jgi:hypothetical protein
MSLCLFAHLKKWDSFLPSFLPSTKGLDHMRPNLAWGWDKFETSVTLWLTVSDSPLFQFVAKGEGKEFCSVSLKYYSITLRWIFFPNNHHRIVLKESVSGNQSYMSSGGHRLHRVTISFQLTNNNNNKYV